MENKIKASLSERIKRTKDIESFRFLPEVRVDFLPGQFTQLIFDSDNLGNHQLNKYLSFSSSPTKQYLEVTKRLSESEFSQKLRGLKPGDKVDLKPAMGSCVFSDDNKEVAFLIGGIGITPVISIIEYIENKRLKTNVILFYSNRTEDIAFKEELDSWQTANDNIKVFYLVTDCEPKDQSCINGAISQELLIEKIERWRDRTFFVFGPPMMVKAMHNLCLKTGCDKNKVKTESFIGY